ncbi:MAG: hypothetical protein IPK58_05255 [Acidobacteria bacterium]|nr:hypothetical protein [Acidobacteriota bacterium]
MKIAIVLISIAFLTAVLSDRSVLPVSAGTESASAPSADANELPELMDFRHKEIGLGQRLFFGVEVIDEEGDLVRTELVAKPKSAKFNQNTLTVDWTPQKKATAKRASSSSRSPRSRATNPGKRARSPRNSMSRS